MLLRIITPTPVHILCMIQSYTEFILKTVDIPFGLHALAATRQKCAAQNYYSYIFYFPDRFLIYTTYSLATKYDLTSASN